MLAKSGGWLHNLHVISQGQGELIVRNPDNCILRTAIVVGGMRMTLECASPFRPSPGTRMLTNLFASSSKSSPQRTRAGLSARVAIVVALFGGLLAAHAQAPATPVQIQENAPDRHVVVKGDTLWGISGKFLKQPWRWPEVWRMNKDQIKNPHLIYPGQVVVLDRNAAGGPRLMIDPSASGPRDTIRLSPTIRAEAREAQAIPTIRPEDIEPFLSRNIVIGSEAFENNPQIVRAVGEHVAFSTNDVFYSVGVKPEMGKVFSVYRKGRELKDPSIPARPWYQYRHNEPDPQIVGYEAAYLGDAQLLVAGDVAKFEVVSVRQEIQVGDYLIPATESNVVRYVPRAPEASVDAVVMTLPSGVSEASKTSVVTLNRGKKHGLEVGHVLAAFKPKEVFANPRYKDSPLNLVPGWPKQPNAEPVSLSIPEERVGLVFVYRVFDNISYGMVMNTGQESVKLGYRLTNP
ncbi:MAG: LysM peptidoglycan-binding domain-containing protein [Betaproteobacteria bacterium]|nr:MAG: LysM peptidoglycan-binding domain-containing protein [Betaproteobacteria bacterium]